jgi:glycosyltransferase involved in cell wall biosynthesis
MTSATGPLPAHEGALSAGACDVTVVMLTFNEAKHVARSIASVKAFARDILIVDSFSTDGTPEIAKAAGARVVQNKFVNYSKQFQWGLDHGGIETAWILRLDADEIIEPDLSAAIVDRLPGLPADVAGVNFNRKHIFLGRWVRHGGRYPLVLLRLWRTGQGRIEDRWMDEHMVVWGGRVVTFEGGFSDDNLNDLTFFTDKHNKYATREAIDVLSRKYQLLPDDRALSADSASRQAHMKRMFKERIYNRLPLWVGPLGYFIYRVIFQGGIFDGKSGMIYHVLQGFWYRYLVNAKIYEYERGMADCTTRAERLERLTALTGHDLVGDTARIKAVPAQ